MTGKQLRIALQIDAAMQKLLRADKDDIVIFAEMAEHMADFKWLIDTAKPGVMDELCRRFAGFFQYAHILGTVAARIQSSAIATPDWTSAGGLLCVLSRRVHRVGLWRRPVPHAEVGTSRDRRHG